MTKEVISDGFVYYDKDNFSRRVPEGTKMIVNALVKTPNSGRKLSFVVERINGHPGMTGKYVDIGVTRNGYSIAKEFEKEYSEPIKKSDLKIWDVFINNNDHLSIVYAITKNNFHIYNYNGSSYPVNRLDTSSTNYKKSDITPDEFFENYPKGIRQEWKKDAEFKAIKNRYLASDIIQIDFSTFEDSNISEETDNIITIYQPYNLLLLL